MLHRQARFVIAYPCFVFLKIGLVKSPNPIATVVNLQVYYNYKQEYWKIDHLLHIFHRKQITLFLDSNLITTFFKKSLFKTIRPIYAIPTKSRKNVKSICRCHSFPQFLVFMFLFFFCLSFLFSLSLVQVVPLGHPIDLFLYTYCLGLRLQYFLQKVCFFHVLQ